MLPVIPYWIDWTAPWMVFAFALLFGSTPERIVAISHALNLTYSIFVRPHGAGETPSVELVQDIAQFAVVAGLAVTYDRWWLLVAGMTGLLMIATDVAGMIMPLHWWAAGTALWTWAWIFFAALAAGTWASFRAKRAGLVDQPRWPWKTRARAQVQAARP